MRIGDAVHRPTTRNSEFASCLLSHLERYGFDAAPRFMGQDDLGRDVLTFLAGDVPADLAHFTDRQLVSAAALMRRYHDATVELARSFQREAEVVCHNDWGPTNTVFRNEQPWGIIDFDTAAPGERLWDLGYAAFLWLDLGNRDYSGAEQMRRLSLFATAYGRTDYTLSDVVAYTIKRQLTLMERGRLEGNVALAEWAADAAQWSEQHLVGQTGSMQRV